METRKPLDGLATGTMLLLCLIWGIQQVVLKLAAPDIAATLQIGLRSLVAACLVAVLVLARGPRMSFDGAHVRAGLGAGLLFALEFLLIGEGLRYTTASHMGVFVYTAPIFTALGLHIALPDERLAPLQWLGVILAFAGVAIAFLGGGPAPAAVPDMLLGDLLGLGAGAAWGLTTVLIRCSTLASAPPPTPCSGSWRWPARR